MLLLMIVATMVVIFGIKLLLTCCCCPFALILARVGPLLAPVGIVVSSLLIFVR